MKQLKSLLEKLVVKQIIGELNVEVSSIEIDSRKVQKNSLFVALRGSQMDGHEYIQNAISKGCKVVVLEDFPKEISGNVVYVLVENTTKYLGKLASAWFSNPSREIKLIGITGTNGKTTCATLLYELFESLGYPSVLLSTIKVCIHKKTYEASHTTPNIIEINRILAEGVAAGCQYAFMEVSSHGIDQDRIKGLDFYVAGFTNITHDHLDYHKTFKNYLKAKKKFFDNLSKNAFAITNTDDKNGLVMLQNSKAKKKTYGLRMLADYHANMLEINRDGMLLKFDSTEFWTQLTGQFNVYNLLLVYGIADVLGISKVDVITKISELKNIDGRFQSYLSEGGITIIVDYAHTPNALENALEAIDEIRTKNEQLIIVFGCGGNRDKEKRPKMAKIASEFSDQIVITDDNPRNENPQEIINQILEGVPVNKQAKCLVIADREQAIKTAISLANENDIILIAGKGHEKYQEVNGVKTDFDDMKTAVDLLNKLKK